MYGHVLALPSQRLVRPAADDHFVKWIINQQKVKQTSSTNQISRYQPTTKDTKDQKEGEILDNIQIKYIKNWRQLLKAQIQ